MEDQLETAFRSPGELGSFLSLITTNLSNRLELSRDAIARGLVANLIASLVSENKSGRVVHLLTEYNTLCGLTGSDALTAATISSRAYAEAVARAYSVFKVVAGWEREVQATTGASQTNKEE